MSVNIAASPLQSAFVNYKIIFTSNIAKRAGRPRSWLTTKLYLRVILQSGPVDRVPGSFGSVGAGL